MKANRSDTCAHSALVETTTGSLRFVGQAILPTAGESASEITSHGAADFLCSGGMTPAVH
jgi:hypothetical protein